VGYDEVAAAVESAPHLSATQIVEMFATRLVMTPRRHQLLLAAVCGAVAAHRRLAIVLSNVANTAFAAGDSSHLQEDMAARLNAAAGRPYDAINFC